MKTLGKPENVDWKEELNKFVAKYYEAQRREMAEVQDKFDLRKSLNDAYRQLKENEEKMYLYEPDQTIKIKYFDPDMPRMKMEKYGDWIDCRAAQDYVLNPVYSNFSTEPIPPILIDLGFACKLPDGYEAHLAPRSSSFKKWGFLVVNSIGIIDNSYCGEDDHWMLAIYPTRKATIHKYDRICQFRIMKKQPNIIFEEVDHLSDESRGGFGSTGVE